MSAAPNPVSSASSRSAPGGDALVGLERARHALPQPGQDPPGRSAEQQDLRTRDTSRRPAHAEHPAVDEVRAERAHAAMMACSWSRCIRSWTPAKTSHSPQRSRPTSGWSSGHGSVSWPATVRAERSTIRWLWAIACAGRPRSASAAPGTPGTTPCASGRPATRRGLRRGKRQAGRASQACPIAWATFQSPSPPAVAQILVGQALDDRGQGIGEDRELRDDAPGGARAGPTLDLAADDDLAVRVDAAPGRDEVRRAVLQRRRPRSSSVAVRHLAGVGSSRRSRHIATIPTTGPSARIGAGEPPAIARRSGRAGRRPGS